MPYPNPADIARMKQDKSINLMEMPGLNVGYLSYNVQKKPLDDVKVRQALTYAVNKDAIIKAVYQGAGVSAKNLIRQPCGAITTTFRTTLTILKKRKPC